MKQEVIDDFIKSLQDANAELGKIKSPMLQTMEWFKAIKIALKPVWQDGYNEGIKEGIKEGKEQERLLKSN